jgi:outer membrane protein assembly factor BamB
MQLLWKLKLDSKSRAMHNLFGPLVAEHATTPQGRKEIAVIAGINDDVFGVDVASGQQIWHRHWDGAPDPPPPANNTLCPTGQTAVPTMTETSPGKYTVYAVSWDGRLRQFDAATGADVAPPEKFVPGGGKPYALNLFKGVIYTATAQGCGGLTNAFYSYDLASKRASAFIPSGGGLWGRRGASVAADGMVYLGTGDGQFDPENQRLGNAIVGVKPVLFDYRNRKFLVGTSKGCRLWLLDRDALGGEDHRTALYTTPLICNDAQAFDWRGIWGALSAWQDASGAQWVLAPFWGPVSRQFKPPIEYGRPAGGGVAAFKLQQKGNAWELTPAWLSRDMDLAEETVIAGGVVFAYAGGEDATQVVPDVAWNEPGGPVYGGGLNSGPARRIPGSRRAVLYALDAQTGKELWSSGTQIESWNHFSGLTVANGRAYIATFDGTLYCFGVKK